VHDDTVLDVPGFTGWHVVPQNIKEIPCAACDAVAEEMLALVAAAADATRDRCAAIWVGMMVAADAAAVNARLKMVATVATRLTKTILQGGFLI
jgi:hypothetical protein